MLNDGFNPVTKLNTVTVDADGYYVMLVNVHDELVGLDISQIKMYALNPSDFSDSSAKSSFFGLINGILNYGELTELTGQRAIMALLGSPGGCTLTGAGIVAFGVLIMAFVRRRR